MSTTKQPIAPRGGSGATTCGKAVVAITVDDTALVRGLKAAEKRMQEFASRLRKVNKSIRKEEKRLNRLERRKAKR